MLKPQYFIFLPIFLVSASPENPSIIIIGAGASGISAASKLLENNISNIKILEAENRIGGRIRTVKFGNGVVDLGAEYCVGEKNNAVYELGKEHLEHWFNKEKMYVYSSNGSEIPEDLALDLNKILDDYDNDLNPQISSLGNAILEKYNQTILLKYAKDEWKHKLAVDAIRMLELLILTQEGSFDWLSPTSRSHYTDCEGDPGLIWKSTGYATVLDLLMRKYPDPEKMLPVEDKVIFKAKVTRISVHSDGVHVQYANTTLSADHLIFTPSIGVLKAYRYTMFEPNLPQSKQNAIDAIGFDGIMKIALHFSNPWWNEKDVEFFLLWTLEDVQNSKAEFPEGPSHREKSWITYISGIGRVGSNPNVLMAWLSSEIVQKIEETPDEILLKGCNHVIRKFLGHTYNVTKADKILKSQWTSWNSNFRGTYSYEKSGYYRDYSEDVSFQEILAEPLKKDGKPVILFAGEATHPTRYGTVHGAIETGRREAQRIVDLYK